MGEVTTQPVTAYYNEIEPFAADWLENLIAQERITPGNVDRRSIVDVRAEDITGFERCHFFAGIAGWDLALQLAGWTGPVWTASCPCQPFSRIGKRKGTDDERHLWPEMLRLIRDGRPAFIFGEQVSGKDGEVWCKGVQADLQSEGYGFFSAELCAASVSRPHNRGRIYWAAVCTDGTRAVQFSADCDEDGFCPVCGIDYAECECPGPTEDGVKYYERDGILYGLRLVYSSDSGLEGYVRDVIDRDKSRWVYENQTGSASEAGDNMCLVKCEGSRWRRIQPESFPLAYGIPRGMGRGQPELASLVRRASGNRKGRLRGYGNAIVPQVAALFISAVMDWINEQ